MRSYLLLLSVLATVCMAACQSNKKTGTKESVLPTEATYTNPLREKGAEPWAVFYKGKYYYTQGEEDRIMLWETADITHLNDSLRKTAWIPDNPRYAQHLWAPELHRIDGKWYIYVTADDGNTDNHQIYVLENDAPTPTEGKFTMKGRISTDKDNNWAIHASTFEHKGKRYLIWSGWQRKRIDSETQCIYIASMKDPWTLSSDRVLISRPDHEWECQWVNPDGSKTAYTIHVNEAPHFFQPKNPGKVCIFYSASGSWTPYYCTGMLTADADADLLNPASWKKNPSPVFQQNAGQSVFGPGGSSIITSPDGKEYYVLYHARQQPNDAPGAIESRSPRLQKIDWDENGMPVFGTPRKIGERLPKPSGTPQP